MLNNEFKKSAIEKLKSMDSNELKNAFKAIGSELQTNEEWFCGLSTEEKAEWLYRVHYGGIGIGLTKEEIRKWLKEVHKE